MAGIPFVGKGFKDPLCQFYSRRLINSLDIGDYHPVGLVNGVQVRLLMSKGIVRE